MCGLCGEIRFDGEAADPDAVGRMCDAMAPRGPDGSGAWAEGRVAFGHRRLSIIDLSDAGRQPMVDDELGLVCVFNGIIYNYRELRTELAGAGYRFTSSSDTEVLLKAYHRWGTGFVDRLVGMFAIVILERASGRVVLARDRLGIKPLYLSQDGRRLRFASTLPALLRGGGVDTTLDAVGLHHYLTWRAVGPAPRTILAGVTKLPPATVRVLDADGSFADRRYWGPDHVRREDRAGWSAEDWTDAVHAALRTAVRRRMVADVPVGVLLSGGLDSSLIVALLAELGQPDLATFSIGFDAAGERAGDEFAYSDVIAERFGTEHHRIRADAIDIAANLPHAVTAMSEPMVSHDNVAFFLLAQEVSKHVRVVQSGQGADEVFAGYHWYPTVAGLEREDAIRAYAGAYFDRDHDQVNRLLADDWRLPADPSCALVAEHLRRPGAQTSVDAALRLDIEAMMVDDPVARVDNQTMAAGIEARVPFLDHELVELAAACPPELKLAQGGKGVLKTIGRRLMPASVIDRPKGYFPVPSITELDGPVLDLVRDALGSGVARRRGLFRAEEIDGLLDDPHGATTRTGARQLWQVGLLELWLQAHGVG